MNNNNNEQSPFMGEESLRTIMELMVDYINIKTNIKFPSVDIENKTTGVPVGTIIPHMGNTAPAQYLICDGSIYNITDYPYLSDHIKNQFGSVNFWGGDGTTTFAVPDLRGEFLRGTGQSNHNTGIGADVGVHQDPTYHVENESIETDYMKVPKNTSITNPDTKIIRSGTLSLPGSIYNSNDDTHSSYSSRPTNTSVLWCIKAEPTFHMNVPHYNYSYEEQVVGTWVDGKPLYEKTINLGQVSSSTNIPIDPIDFDIIFGSSFVMRNIDDPSNLRSVCWPNDSGNYTIYRDHIEISNSNGYNNGNMYLTLRYTKATS